MIEELLSIKYGALNDAEQTDIATTIRNAILIPNNLNVSDDCLRILCNRRAQDSSLVLDTTTESPAKSPAQNACSSQSSSGSEPISDQDLRCARELAYLQEDEVKRRVLPQVSPLPRGLIISGTPILNGDNSGNALFDRIGDVAEEGKATSTPNTGRSSEQLTFNGRIPVPLNQRLDHVIIQIEPDTSRERLSIDAAIAECPVSAVTDFRGTETGEDLDENDKLPSEERKESSGIGESFEFTNERSPDLFADNEEDDDDDDEDVNYHENVEENTSLNAAAEDAPVSFAIDRLMQRDNHLLKRLQNSFSGVLPPPSVTNVTISLDVIINRYKEFNGQMPEPKASSGDQTNAQEPEQYLLKSVDSPATATSTPWPELKNVVCHDV